MNTVKPSPKMDLGRGIFEEGRKEREHRYIGTIPDLG